MVSGEGESNQGHWRCRSDEDRVKDEDDEKECKWRCITCQTENFSRYKRKGELYPLKRQKCMKGGNHITIENSTVTIKSIKIQVNELVLCSYTQFYSYPHGNTNRILGNCGRKNMWLARKEKLP